MRLVDVQALSALAGLLQQQQKEFFPSFCPPL